MLLRQVVRLFGWIISSVAGTVLLYDLYQLVTRYPLSALLNQPTLIQAGVIIFYIIGMVLSTQNQVVGGILTFLSPLIYIIIYSIAAGYLVTPFFIVMMMIGGVFLLFTAEREH